MSIFQPFKTFAKKPKTKYVLIPLAVLFMIWFMGLFASILFFALIAWGILKPPGRDPWALPPVGVWSSR